MKHISAINITLLLAITLFAVNSNAVLIDSGKSDVSGIVAYAPDRIVVKFDPSMMNMMDKKAFKYGKTGISVLDELGMKHGVDSIKQQFPGVKKKLYKGSVVDLTGWHKLKFSNKADVLSVVEDYKKISGVIDAQPVSIHTVYRIPSDEFYGVQWHLPKIGAPEAWDIETGNADVIVAVLDTGVRYFHKDLGGANASLDFPSNADGNMWINWAEKNNGIDDDGNGKKDDWIGWDFVETTPDDGLLIYCWPGEDCSGADNDPRDFNGHGTHCAGSVAAMNDNNGYGAASIAGGWCNGTFSASGNGVKVMPLRIGWSSVYVFWEVGMVAMDYAAEALYYAAENGSRIASCSWGSENTGGIGDAINYFLASGGLIFKAAGNDGAESFDYMGSRNDIIKVAATDQNDCKADFSNYGTWINISAPGVSILSLYHVHDDPAEEYVAYLDGTSMAAPLAASVAALIWSQNPALSAEQVKQKLYASADNIYGLSCNSLYSGKLGAGRINAFRAVGNGSTPPVANFSGTPTSGYKPLIVQFTDLSTGSITSRSWNFGDGSTSTEQNPLHTYNAAGTYTVSLTVSGPGGSDTETKTNYIQVTETPPVANFSGSPTSGYSPLTVQFSDSSTGLINSRAWNFGDGWTSSLQNPAHTYNNAGRYTVSLSVTGPGGIDTETKVDYITALQPTQIGVDSLQTGKYQTGGKGSSRTTTFITTDTFMQGDAVIVRAYVEDTAKNSPIANAIVNIAITGPASVNLSTGPSNAAGMAEAKWQTTKPNKRGVGGTPTGAYTAAITNVTATGYTWDGLRTNTGFTISTQ